NGHAVACRCADGETARIYARSNAFLDSSGNFAAAFSVDDQNLGTVELIAEGNDFRDVTAAFSPMNGTILARNNWGYVTENWGNASISPDSSGNGTIAHGLAGTPDFVSV